MHTTATRKKIPTAEFRDFFVDVGPQTMRYVDLKRVPKVEIDEADWSTLYQSTGQPFPRPETGKIAVKVINHHGDEVLKVYSVG